MQSFIVELRANWEDLWFGFDTVESYFASDELYLRVCGISTHCDKRFALFYFLSSEQYKAAY